MQAKKKFNSGANTTRKAPPSSQPRSVKKRRIINVNPQTMPDGFNPSGSQVNLTQAFLKPDKTSSVSWTGTKLMSGYIPEGLNPDITHFYIKSTRHGRYFKLDITWSD